MKWIVLKEGHEARTIVATNETARPGEPVEVPDDVAERMTGFPEALFEVAKAPPKADWPKPLHEDGDDDDGKEG